MECPNCGKEIDANSKFCEYCGTQVKKNRKPLFIAIAIVACLLVLGGIGLTQYNKGEQEYKLNAEEAESKANGNINGHEYVDLGLSVKWATCNVGASNPEDFGNYYAWGETSTKTEYTEDNSKTYGKSMGDIKGNSNYDAARANWGGDWRMPTRTEMQELIDNCEWEWTAQNGVNGYKVTGPNGNSIFLPAAGYRIWSSLYDAGEYGYYWSSTPYESSSNDAYDLYFNSSEHYVDYYIRNLGLSVRPVLE